MPHQCTDCGRTFDDGSKEMLAGCPECGGNKFQFRPDEATRESSAAADDGGPDPSTNQPERGNDDIVVADDEPPTDPSPPVDSTVARTVGKAATTVRDFVGSDAPERGAPKDLEAHGSGPLGGDRTTDEPAVGSSDRDPQPSGVREDNAQASARTDVVSPDDLPPAPEHPATAETGGTETGGTARSTPEGSATTDTAGSAEEYQDPVDRPDLADLREELNEQFESIKVLEPGQYELNLMELYDREEYIIALQEDGKYTIQVPDGYGEG